MTCKTLQMKIITVLMVAIGGALLSGCASPHLAATSTEVRYRLQWPTIEIDRYEPVVYPAGPMD